jgi:hypothetical protein
MKRKLARLLMVSMTVSASMKVSAQALSATDTISKGKYTLIFINKDQGFSTETKNRMIDAFFTVYPKEARRFNRGTLRTVKFVIDPAYKGVAETGDGVAKYNPEWLKKNPEDIDVVTHEVMHIVQDYRFDNPGWLTEGIADYVRYVYGVNNVKSKWTLPNYRNGQSYENAYRVTARFLVWVEKEKNKKIVDKMDAALRAGTYKPELWVKLTGKTVAELWKEYSGNPALTLTYK